MGYKEKFLFNEIFCLLSLLSIPWIGTQLPFLPKVQLFSAYSLCSSCLVNVTARPLSYFVWSSAARPYQVRKRSNTSLVGANLGWLPHSQSSTFILKVSKVLFYGARRGRDFPLVQTSHSIILMTGVVTTFAL